MIVEEQNVITLSYELRKGGPEGEVLEKMDANYPFKFLYGAGRLLPAFEKHIAGLQEGESFEFTIPPEEAYGPVEEDNIIDLPRAAFRNEGGEEPPGLVIEGNFIEVTDDQGNVHNGQILSFDDQQVRVDFNHAMAGKSLHFRGVVLNVRKARTDELIRKQYIEEDGAHNPGEGE